MTTLSTSLYYPDVSMTSALLSQDYPPTGNAMDTKDSYMLRYPARVVGPRKPAQYMMRLAYAEALVDMTALVIETVWPAQQQQQQQHQQHQHQQQNGGATTVSSSPAPYAHAGLQDMSAVPLRLFIREVLKRSRTTHSTLQTALFYLFRARPMITAALNGTASPLHLQHDQNAYIGCGRRMFLASLVVASKFVHDKTYRNSAWAKMAGLPVVDIHRAERSFLILIDYQLYITPSTFDQWHQLVHAHIHAKIHIDPPACLDGSYRPRANPPTTTTTSSPTANPNVTSAITPAALSSPPTSRSPPPITLPPPPTSLSFIPSTSPPSYAPLQTVWTPSASTAAAFSLSASSSSSSISSSSSSYSSSSVSYVASTPSSTYSSALPLSCSLSTPMSLQPVLSQTTQSPSAPKGCLRPTLWAPRLPISSAPSLCQYDACVRAHTKRSFDDHHAYPIKKPCHALVHH